MNREQRRAIARASRKAVVKKPTVDAFEFEKVMRFRIGQEIVADETVVEYLPSESKTNPTDVRTALARHYSELIQIKEATK